MRLVFAAAAAAAFSASAFAATPHHCAADTLSRAGDLLKWYWNTPDAKLADKPGEPVDGSPDMAWSLDEDVKVLPPVSAPGTSEKYDVLEVFAHVYKASFRIRMLYVQIPDDCALAGAEIISQ